MAKVRASFHLSGSVSAPFRRLCVTDVFQEVEEEYRREQMAKFWQKYSMAVIGGAAALIVGVAAFEGWTYWRARQLDASSRGFEVIAEKIAAGPGNEKAAADAFAKLAATGTGGYPLAAQFQEAALRGEMGDVKAAVKLYDAIAAKGSGGVLFRDYAHLRASLLLVETAPLDEVKKRLDPIVGTGPCAATASPWCPQAQEILAYGTWRAGKKAEALKLYENILALPVEPDTVVSEPAGTKRYISRITERRAKEMSALINAGMTLNDIKAPPAATKPSTASESLLLPPAPAPEQPRSLLGPDPAQPPTP